MILVSGLVIISVNLGVVTAASNASGRIEYDTTWTKAGGPYTLTGTLAGRHRGNFDYSGRCYREFEQLPDDVMERLKPQGSSTDKIQFNGGTLTVTQSSAAWNEQAGSGCLIQNANFDSSNDA